MPNFKSNTVHQTAILPGQIKARHLEANLAPIKIGVSSDLPSSPGTNSHYFAFFETDTNKLKIWNTSEKAWKETTLT